MRSTGIRRKVDDLGRVVIPAGIRRTLGIREGDALEFAVQGDEVILTRPVERCVFCGTEDGPLQTFRSKRLCPGCIGSVAALDGGVPTLDPPAAVPTPTQVSPLPDPRSRAVDEADAVGSGFEERYRALEVPREAFESTTAW